PPAATMPAGLPSVAPSGDSKKSETVWVSSHNCPAKWQAAKCPLSFISSGGSTSEQIFCAIGQRVWNRQAGGGLTGEGISPFRRIGFRAASRSGSGTGTELSSTLV